MKDQRQKLPMLVLPIVAAAAIGVVAVVSAQTAPVARQEAFDFTKAVTAEVRNAQGQVVLTGAFAETAEEDDDIERKAPLKPTGVDADAAGEAEVEFDRTGSPRRQEVEFSVSNVQAGAVFTFVIDGKVFATATADAKGRASHERDVPLPTTTSR